MKAFYWTRQINHTCEWTPVVLSRYTLINISGALHRWAASICVGQFKVTDGVLISSWFLRTREAGRKQSIFLTGVTQNNERMSRFSALTITMNRLRSIKTTAEKQPVCLIYFSDILIHYLVLFIFRIVGPPWCAYLF